MMADEEKTNNACDGVVWSNSTIGLATATWSDRSAAHG